MNGRIVRLFAFACLLVLGVGCRKDAAGSDSPVGPGQMRMAIRVGLQDGADSKEDTKVVGAVFETGDKVGLYVVNQPDSLASYGNHIDNVPFTFSGSVWYSETVLYWQDDTTHADFYCYYPYSESIGDVGAYAVSVAADQNSDDGFYGSDILWGCTRDVAPTPEPVPITLRHLTSCLQIVLKPGAGWTDADIHSADVLIAGVKNAGAVNLSDGRVTVEGESASVRPYCAGSGVYKAHLLPQSVSAAPLVQITVGGLQYVFDTTIALVSGTKHTCTIIVNRVGEGISIAIEDWESDDVDYGGIVK